MRRVHIKNWRGFEEINVELDRDFTLLAGVNGSGKSSLLGALEVGLAYFMKHWCSRGTMRDTRPRTVLSRDHGEIRREARDAELAFEVALDGATWRYAWHGATRSFTHSAEHPGGPIGHVPATLPLVASIDALRSPPPLDESDKGSRLLGYVGWGGTDASWSALVAWLKSLTESALTTHYLEVQAGGPSRPLHTIVPELGAATRAVRDCIGEVEDVGYVVQKAWQGVVITMVNGDMVPADLLSDGYRALLGTVADLARRCVVLNPHLGADAATRTPGVVLIDELELHLHPRWQRAIVKGLSRAFPLVQFICATHSPQILAEAPRGSVVLLAPGDEVRYPTFTHGRDANAILEELLETPARPSDIDNRLKGFRRALDDARFAVARSELDSLANELGEDVREVVEARWTLKVEESLHGDGAEP